jgi:uncharacterized protein YcaQ
VPNPVATLPRISAGTARRLLLGAQVLLERPERATTASVLALVERLGYVQIDSINIVARAHHLILAPRLLGYRPSLLARLLEKDRRLFEHWTHDAAAIPTAWYPHWRHRFVRYREEVQRKRWWGERMGRRPERTVDQVRERLARNGPLLSRDLAPTPSGEKKGRAGQASSSWWGWTPQKAALEYLWYTGEAAIAGRVNFHKLYDLTERVLPPEVTRAPASDPGAHLEWACRSALERLGIAGADEIAAFWGAVPLAAVRAWCETAAAEGTVVRLASEAAGPGGAGERSDLRLVYALPDWQARADALPAGPSAGGRLRLLCPFDPILWHRRRTLRLFGFDYRFEAFVPAGQRRHGYYVMPILEGDRLVGRLDPKLHREAGRLEVRALSWEPGLRPSRRRRLALEAALDRLARSLGAERWSLPAD